jgi:hypothetical protein
MTTLGAPMLISIVDPLRGALVVDLPDIPPNGQGKSRGSAKSGVCNHQEAALY